MSVRGSFETLGPSRKVESGNHRWLDTRVAAAERTVHRAGPSLMAVPLAFSSEVTSWWARELFHWDDVMF